jgi:hypothetical protein
MRKRYLALIVAVVVVAANDARATSVVYVTSSCGMAVGADGKTAPFGIGVGADGKTAPAGTAVKIALLKNRLVVADLYYESAKAPGGSAVLYNFPTWVRQIDNSTDADISLSGLVEVIKKQMASTFSFVSEAIKNGKLTKEQAGGMEQYIVQYVVAGYENGVPLVYSLTLMPDWDAKTVNGPFEVVLKKGEPKNSGFDFGWRGRGTGLNLINTANSEPEREFNDRIRAELDLIHSGHCLTSEHLSNVARSMLVIETKYDPHYVGFPLTVIDLPKNGNGTVITYESNTPAMLTLP